ncbi:MAG: helix-turn-helix transcriptional regulator [Bacteroidales bacterium]|nr:helix-turn-helix transcriptional regulator [Bacteroidales bacterium]
MKFPRNKESSLDVAGRRISGYESSSVLARVFSAAQECLDDGKYSVENVAAKLSMTRGHLYRLVKERTGRSVSSLLDDYRFVRAASLLEGGNFTVTQVAYKSGYSDLAHFSIAFKRFSGMSPSKYRSGR